MKKKEETRMNIIETATELFMTKGYRATSTRKIAAKLGITQPNLYHHFNNKEALYLAVIETLAADVSEHLTTVLTDPELTFSEKLTQMSIYLNKTHPFDFFMMLHDIHSELSEELSKKIYVIWKENYQRPFVELFESYSGQLRFGYSPEKIASYFFNTIAPYIKKEEDSSSFSIQQVVELFIYGLLE